MVFCIGRRKRGGEGGGEGEVPHNIASVYILSTFFSFVLSVAKYIN